MYYYMCRLSYVSSYYCIYVFTGAGAGGLLYMCPHTTVYMCPRTAAELAADYICVLVLLYICVLILLYICVLVQYDKLYYTSGALYPAIYVSSCSMYVSSF